MEVDYKQLEIFVLAYLSQDPQLMDDLKSGKDLHGIAAERLFGPGFTKEQRTQAKQMSFQLQYGAGYKSMSEKLGVPEHVAKMFIKQFYDRYPKVKEWQEFMIDIVKMNRNSSNKRTKTGIPAGISTMTTEYGRRYVFTEYDAPQWMQDRGIPTAFSPTEIKNYPVQGLATGDIVPIMLGKLYRAACNWTGYRAAWFIDGTVHDSVRFDCDCRATAEWLARQVKEVLESAPQVLKEVLGIDFNLPLRVDCSIGPNWKEMEELTL